MTGVQTCALPIWTESEFKYFSKPLPHSEHVLAASYVVINTPTYQSAPIFSRDLWELLVGEIIFASRTTVPPRHIPRNPSLDAFSKVFEIHNLARNTTSLNKLSTVTDRTSLAWQFDHLVDLDDDSASLLLQFIYSLETTICPNEHFLSLVIEICTFVDVVKTWKVRFLFSKPM